MRRSGDPRSVEDIARDSGVDRNTIWFWVRGQTTNPNIAQVDKVARALGFSLELAAPGGAAQVPRLRPPVKAHNLLSKTCSKRTVGGEAGLTA